MAPDSVESLDELEAERDDLEFRIADIDAQLSKAKQQAAATGEYADPKWYASTEAARRYKKVELDQLNRRIKKLKQARTEHRDRQWEQAFVRMAKQTLSEETYDRLVALAWEETGERP